MKKLIAGILLSITPFTIIFTKLNLELVSDTEAFLLNIYHVFGNFLGITSAILFIWTLLIGIRPIARLFDKDILKINKVHGFFGKYIIITLLGHILAILPYYNKEFSWIFFIDLSKEFSVHVTMGRVAFFLFLLVWVTSAILREKIKFWPWVYIHILVFPMAFLFMLHSNDIGSFLIEFGFLGNLWKIYFLILILATLYRIWDQVGWVGREVKIVGKEKLSNDIWVITFENPKQKIHIEKGDYIYFKKGMFANSHPFSILKTDRNNFKIAFKIFGKFTKKLTELNINDTVKVEGSYGGFLKTFDSTENTLFVAGGIGITPFFDLLTSKKDLSKTFLLYSSKDKQSMIYLDELQKALPTRVFKFFTGEIISKLEQNEFSSRINKDVLSNLFPGISDFKVFLCGSRKFNKDLERVFLELEIPKKNIVIEDFG